MKLREIDLQMGKGFILVFTNPIHSSGFTNWPGGETPEHITLPAFSSTEGGAFSEGRSEGIGLMGWDGIEVAR